MDHVANVFYVNVGFDECLCTPPKYITVLDTGQAIAEYQDAPAMPYDSLLDLLEDHAQGMLTADDIRARMQPNVAYASAAGSAVAGTSEKRITDSELVRLARKARKFYGAGAVQFALA